MIARGLKVGGYTPRGHTTRPTTTTGHQNRRQRGSRPPDTPARLLLLWTGPKIATHTPRFVTKLRAWLKARTDRRPPAA